MRDLLPFLRLLAGRRARLVFGALLMLLTVVAVIGLLSLSGWFITATAVTAALWAAGTRVAFDVYVPGAGIRLFALTRTVARYFERLYNHDTVLRLLADLRGHVFAAFARLQPAALARLRAAERLNRLTADIDTLDNLYLRLLAPPLVALLAVFGVAVLIGLFVPSAAVTTGLLLLLLLVAITAGAAWLGNACSERLVQTGQQLRVRLVEQFQGLAELSAYGTLAQHRRQLAREESRLLADQRRLGRGIAAANAGVTTGIHLAAVLALLSGLSAYQAGAISAPILVLLPLAVIGLGEAFAMLPAAFARFGGTRAAARRLTAEWHGNTSSAASLETVPLPDHNGIEFFALDFLYPYAEQQVLRDVNLAVADAEHVAIVGASGCGKSTLLQLVARLLEPTAGALRLGGIDLRCLDPVAVRGRVALLTQRSELFEDTIAANLRIAAPAASETELWRALQVAGLEDFVRGLPAGLDTWIGESGRQLSGGEGRRLALARIVLRDPAIVLLDEPLAGLDPTTARQVAQALQSWLHGRTLLACAHEPRALPAVDRVFSLSAGKLEPLAQN